MIPTPLLLLVGSAVLLVCGPVRAQVTVAKSAAAVTTQRGESPSGRRYVVVERIKKGHGVTFTYCERAGEAPVGAAAGGVQQAPGAGGEAGRDPGDRLITNGEVGLLPHGILVPDTIDGFLLFGSRRAFRRGPCVTWVDGRGDVTVDLRAEDLFGRLPGLQGLGVNRDHWWTGYWIDEAARSIVVVSREDGVREIAIANGRVATPAVDRLLTWASSGPMANRACSLEALATGDRAGRMAAAPFAVELFHDERAPITLRMRAAVLLARAGSPVACDQLFRAALVEGQPEGLRCYAVRHLPGSLRNRGLAVLRELLPSGEPGLSEECQRALAEYGDRAVPMLLEVLRDEAMGRRSRVRAARALGRIKDPAVCGLLVELAATFRDPIGHAAYDALVAIDPRDLPVLLTGLLSRGSPHDGSIAIYLRDHPTRAALSAIDTALGRENRRLHRMWLQQAREACAAFPDEGK